MPIKKITASEYHLATGLFNKYRMFYGKPAVEALAESFIKERLENNESVIFVAIADDGTPAGFTQLYPLISSVRAVKNWVLNDLYVTADHRRQGIGESLINAAMNFAKSLGSVYIQLETGADNHQAQKLYETIGFKKQQADAGYLVYKKELI